MDNRAFASSTNNLPGAAVDLELGLPMNNLKDVNDCSNMTERQFSEYLDSVFYPIFEPAEKQGGLPPSDVIKLFKYRDFGIPSNKSEDLIIKLDKNRNGKISYKEFKSYMIGKRYLDLSKIDQFGLCAILAGNPGMRLRSAKRRIRRKIARELIKRDERVDSKNIQELNLGDPLRGGYQLPGNKFILEPDGIWPTSRAKLGISPGDMWDSNGPVLTLKNENYIPDTYLKAYNCRPPPIFIPLLVIAQIAVFIYYAVLINQRAELEPWNVVSWASGYPYFSPLAYDPQRRKEVWRFFTYIFIHSGIIHLIINCVFTLILGLLIEWVNKFWRVFPVYLSGVLAGSLASSVLDPYVILVGSSGGVYSLLGAHLALTIINWEEMKHDWTNIKNGPIPCLASGITRVILILTFICLDFAIALYRRYGLQDELTISFTSHVFGFAAGLLIGIPVLKNIEERPWEKILYWISIVIFLLFIIVCVIFNIFWPYYPAQVV